MSSLDFESARKNSDKAQPSEKLFAPGSPSNMQAHADLAKVSLAVSEHRIQEKEWENDVTKTGSSGHIL